MSLQQLAEGGNLSLALAGFLTGAGISARETTTVSTGHAIARALDVPVTDLFVLERQVTREVPTSQWQAV
jgi:hypothetical protein